MDTHSVGESTGGTKVIFVDTEQPFIKSEIHLINR